MFDVRIIDSQAMTHTTFVDEQAPLVCVFVSVYAFVPCACARARVTAGLPDLGSNGCFSTTCAGFWAPEMHGTDPAGRSRVYSSSVDFWSLGCLIFTLLTGK